MDGSAATGLANEVTITTDGLLILFYIGAAAVAVGLGLLWRGLKTHLDDCSGHRATFHKADRRMERKIAVLATNMEWLIRNAGHEPVPMPTDDEDDE